MSRLIYLSHPEVVIDPDVPVPDWGLSDTGRARLEAALARGWPRVERVVSSAERKAKDAAQVIASALGMSPEVEPALGEIDRSATGFVPPERHEALRLRLFGEPDVSADGWETAVAAQARALAALERVLAPGGDVLVVGHGGVGTLTWCALSGLPVAAHHDQKRMGSVWQAEGPLWRPEGPWVALEEAAAG